MSKELEQDLTHVEEADALLPEQFKNSTNLKAFIHSMINRVQEAENMLFDLWQSRWIDNASGVQLDGLGSIVGIDRDGDSDTVYRLRIRARILSNVSNGTGDDVIRVAQTLADAASVSVTYSDLYPAAFQLQLTGGTITSDLLAQLYDGVKRARPAGVAFYILYSYVAETSQFAFSSQAGVIDTGDTLKGFADSSSVAGGHLAGVIQNG